MKISTIESSSTIRATSRRQQHRRTCMRAFGIVLLLYTAARSTILAQCNSSIKQFGGAIAHKDSSGNWVRADTAAMSTFWDFEMRYDSCLVLYVISDIRIDGQRIGLENWCHGEKINCLSADSLSLFSHTVPVSLSTNDTISFYREFSWYNPVSGTRTTSNYKAQDSLDYVVELVRASSGTRLAVLDSFGILRRIPSGTPSLHGSRPIVTLARYVVPSSLNGESAVVRMHVYSRGDGPHYFLRHSGLTANLPSRTNDSTWQAFTSIFGGGLGKRSPTEFHAAAPTEESAIALRVVPNPTRRNCTIEFSLASEGTTSVVVFNTAGDVVFAPVITTTNGGTGTASYSAAAPGTYVVALIHGGRLVRSAKLIVNR